MNARVIVTLKLSVLDPQGKAIETALKSLGVDVLSVRQGKVFDIELADQEPEEARRKLETACEKLLANPVVERFKFEFH